MLQYISRRLFSLVPVLLFVSFAVFALVFLIPGDAARTIAGGEDASEERVQEVRERLGLDDAMLVQYGRWLGGVLQGDLGESLFTGRTVFSELTRRFPVTASLALGALTFTVLIGIPAGIVAGLRPNRFVDKVVTAGSSVGIAVPSFWLALVLVMLFAVRWRWFPAIGYTYFTENPLDWLRSITLPSIALGVSGAAVVARQLRGALVDVLNADYVRTARAKGLSTVKVVGKHALKNAMMPVLTIMGIQVGRLLGGTVIIERIFGLPGVGNYVYDALFNLDLPVVQGAVVVMVLIVVVINLFTDIAYGYVNPKMRLG